MTTKEEYTETEKYLADELTAYIKEEKIDPKVIYEYVRISINFLRFAKDPEGSKFTTEQRNAHIQAKLKEYLDIENNSNYRNKLAALKKLFAFMLCYELIEPYKFRNPMPSFSIKSPSLEQMVKFGKAIENERIRVYYYLGVVSAIRPEHLLRLRKGLFDTENRMINTWMKTFGKKNFFFSFYTEETKPLIEKYLATIPDNKVLFPIGKRYICKEFCKASIASGIKITPKTMRKFMTNWLSRHGMIPMDVDAITSHLSHRVVATNYVDSAIMVLRENYDESTKDMKLLGGE